MYELLYITHYLHLGQVPIKHCDAHCDVCKTQPTVRQLDVTSLALEIGKCIQKIKNDCNGKKLTVKQLHTLSLGRKPQKSLIKSTINYLAMAVFWKR